MSLCEEFWAVLAEGRSTSKAEIDAFVDMLSLERSFRLAREVIPELRIGRLDGTGDSPQGEIIRRLQPLVENDPVQIHHRSDTKAKDIYYEGEKDCFAELDCYPAELLLCEAAATDTQDQEAIRSWLAMRPKLKTTGLP